MKDIPLQGIAPNNYERYKRWYNSAQPSKAPKSPEKALLLGVNNTNGYTQWWFHTEDGVNFDGPTRESVLYYAAKPQRKDFAKEAQEAFFVWFKERLKDFEFLKTLNLTKKPGILIGSDPELFVVDGSGVIIPAFLFLPDKKGIPKDDLAELLHRYDDDAISRAKLKARPWYGGASPSYWDGFQAEWNMEPRTCHEEIVDRYHHGLRKLRAAALATNPEAKLTYKCALPIPPEMMAATHQDYYTFGCSPSRNAYDESPMRVEEPQTLLWRFAGCHVHHGMPKELRTVEEVERRVRGMDRVMGPIMTSLLAGLEQQERRLFYGRAGEYRMPAHGMEYRVPSSAMLVHPLAAHIILDGLRYASTLAYFGADEHHFDIKSEEAREVLNSLNVDLARALIKKNEAVYQGMYVDIWMGSLYETAWKMITEGIASFIDPDDFEYNWRLGPEFEGIQNKQWSEVSSSDNAEVARININTLKRAVVNATGTAALSMAKQGQ